MYGALRQGGVPLEYRSPKWELCQQAKDLKAWCTDLDRRLKRGEGLLMPGDLGTGKSHAAALVCVETVKLGRSVRWAYLPEMLTMLESARGTRHEELTRQAGADLLVWDDFGVTVPSEWHVGWLDQIVEDRYSSRRPMVITTNWTTKRLKEDQRLGRMVDRWRERNLVLYFVGESQRRPDQLTLDGEVVSEQQTMLGDL